MIGFIIGFIFGMQAGFLLLAFLTAEEAEYDDVF